MPLPFGIGFYLYRYWVFFIQILSLLFSSTVYTSVFLDTADVELTSRDIKQTTTFVLDKQFVFQSAWDSLAEVYYVLLVFFSVAAIWKPDLN